MTPIAIRRAQSSRIRRTRPWVTGRAAAGAVLSFAVLLLAPAVAGAQCSCPAGGIPLISSAKMKGNDLNEVRGVCVPKNATVELQVYQQHVMRRDVCPPRCPSKSIYSFCIDQCAWTTIASTTADGLGHFRFGDLDRSQSVQLIASLPSQPKGLDGVYTALRVRALDPATNQWSAWVPAPYLEAFNLDWPGYEGGFAFVEARISGAHEVHVAVADGPDDGDQPAIALDVDEDTPNFWLSRHPEATVEYTRYGICDPSQGCPSSWHIMQSPSISVQSPPLGRGAEFPYVLGMVSASRPGAFLIATTILGPRDIPDVSVQVNVDLNIDFNLGFDFFSLF